MSQIERLFESVDKGLAGRREIAAQNADTLIGLSRDFEALEVADRVEQAINQYNDVLKRLNSGQSLKVLPVHWSSSSGGSPYAIAGVVIPLDHSSRHSYFQALLFAHNSKRLMDDKKTLVAHPTGVDIAIGQVYFDPYNMPHFVKNNGNIYERIARYSRMSETEKDSIDLAVKHLFSRKVWTRKWYENVTENETIVRSRLFSNKGKKKIVPVTRPVERSEQTYRDANLRAQSQVFYRSDATSYQSLLDERLAKTLSLRIPPFRSPKA